MELVAVPAGALVALSVPLFALKEVLEKRTITNFSKQMGRKLPCRVHFGELDTPIPSKEVKKIRSRTSSGCESNKTAPPTYNDLFQPPPAYTGEIVKA